MAEIKLISIKSIYGDIRGLLSQIPQPEISGSVDKFLVEQLNNTLDVLTSVASTDYSVYKVPHEQELTDWPDRFDSKIVRAQAGRVISRLEQEYGFGQNGQTTTSPGIVIFNKNQNEISLQINYTIPDLIEQSGDEESKNKLKELKEELEKSDKNWEKIKDILIWILNFSRELFIKIIPILLEKKL